MVIKWKGPAQHLDRVLVKPGDVVDTDALGIPDDAAAIWVRDGDAEEVKKKPARKTGGEEA
jgi:hypothetical protein